jgi:FAD/FMN-containing dehydrogenase
MASPRFRDTGRFVRRPATIKTLRPANLADLMRCLDPASRVRTPVRIRGAGTAATDCNSCASGTLIDMTGLDRILRIDPCNRTVTAEAGVRLGVLVEALAAEGLELVGNHDQMERTLGGAIASPCIGAGIGGKAAYLSTQLVSLKLVTSGGKLMSVTHKQRHLLNAMRLSYGLLGAICEVTLRVRPIAMFTADHRSMDITCFADVANRLARADVGQRFYILPYRDRVYLDLRRYGRSAGSANDTGWRIKDFGESTVLPHVFKSLNRVLPIPAVRYRLMDRISTATHGLVNTKLVTTGNNATATGPRRRRKPRNLWQSTWCFPASDFSVVIKAYREFCNTTLATSGFRTDMPALGFRLGRDTSALLSPSFDEPLVALQTMSTNDKGWEDFVIDLAQFAENWGGVPLFNLTRATRAEYTRQIYGDRLEFFRKIRRQLDPRGRLLNPFLAQYFS